MNVVRFEKEKHLETVNRWCDLWGMSRFPDHWLPATGFIVEGVLAAFMYKTDSGVAYIECVISNREVDHSIRNEAMRRVSDRIVVEARECGFKTLLGLTANWQVAKASFEEGYTVTKSNFAILRKDLY